MNPEKDLSPAEIDHILRGGLPDCRLSASNRPMRRTPVGLMEQVFCANCGRSGGQVIAGTTTWAFYLCDPCVTSPLAARDATPGLIEIPESIVRGVSDDSPN
jgi:hypothetical protein